MFNQVHSFLGVVQVVLHRLSMLVFLLSALTLTALTVLAALGHAPWLEFIVHIGGTPYDQAGHVAQIAITGLAVLLCVYLPSNWRILRLESSHRRFEIGMRDVARAYAMAHAADRDGLFQLSSEFDAVRERLAYLRDHPDLGALEPALLEVAAQMSHISRELAEVYSDDRVARARAFLTQRQQEVEAFNARLEQAKQTCRELKHWAHQVELEESVAVSQLTRLRDELQAILPEMGLEDTVGPDGRIVDIAKKAAE
ncbi:DNA repair protein [Roseobacter sp. AzwK-3b]|uniref:DNA repair protein n=1 Tax=Roseobacter sp. AzwK-3b TaxID=351016 RepID=UPI00336AE4BC